ncbi:hypothetical protein CAOG_005824 [Capsaspora owczarzaki ATCC 30864]|uniref:SMP-LTD domain-containing protein n=2 Tax=Capsaspora owczarzaki (strain ATCC 30864) TaxID=595528 RepID=A0A0D2UJU2_CAPO3|nr:hypothetical protein CAOG_005824 [Capsaspora owczarzaki ATCC 30864]
MAAIVNAEHQLTQPEPPAITSAVIHDSISSSSSSCTGSRHSDALVPSRTEQLEAASSAQIAAVSQPSALLQLLHAHGVTHATLQDAESLLAGQSISHGRSEHASSSSSDHHAEVHHHQPSSPGVYRPLLLLLQSLETLRETAGTSAGVLFGILIAIVPQVFVVLLLIVFPTLTRQMPYLLKKPQVLVKPPAEHARITQLLERAPTKESCIWLNALASRLWIELHQTKIKPLFTKLVQDELDDLFKLPAGGFLISATVVECNGPPSAPSFSNMSIIHPQGEVPSVMLAADISALSGFQFAVKLAVRYLEAPIYVALQCEKFEAQLLIEIFKRPESMISYGFSRMPHLDLKINSFVLHQHTDSLRRLIFSLVKKMLTKKFVLPNLKTRWMNPQAPPFRQGYLMHFIRKSDPTTEKILPATWKRGWVVLKSKSLTIFENHLVPRPFLTVPLECISSNEVALSDSQRYCMALEAGPIGSLFLASRTPVLGWQMAINDAVSRLRQHPVKVPTAEEIVVELPPKTATLSTSTAVVTGYPTPPPMVSTAHPKLAATPSMMSQARGAKSGLGTGAHPPSILKHT